MVHLRVCHGTAPVRYQTPTAMTAATPICTTPKGSAWSGGSPSPRAAARVQKRTPVAQMTSRPAQFQRGVFMAPAVSWHGRRPEPPPTANGWIER